MRMLMLKMLKSNTMKVDVVIKKFNVYYQFLQLNKQFDLQNAYKILGKVNKKEKNYELEKQAEKL